MLTEAKVLRLHTSASGRQVTEVVADVNRVEILFSAT